MTTFLISFVITAFAGLLALYFFFPRTYVDMILRLVRKICRLKTRYISVAGVLWPYLEGGPESAEVLVLLHGFGAEKDNWTKYAWYFTKKYRVIVPDLPGFGGNSKNPDADYHVYAQTENLHEFLQALGISKCHLAGNSMGGYITLNYSLTYPEDLLTSTLFNNAGVLGENKSELEQALDRGENLLAVNSMEDFERILELMSYEPLYFPGIVKRVLCKEMIGQAPFLDKVFWSLANEILANPLNDSLPQVSVPTLIIWGRHDRLVDVSCTDVMAALIPDNHCVVMEETGHVPILEKAKESAALHIDYMEKHG